MNLGVFLLICGVLMSMIHLSLYIIVYRDKVTYLPSGCSQLFYYSPLVWQCLRKYRQERAKAEDDQPEIVVLKYFCKK